MDELLRCRGECAAQHRLVDEVDAELEGVAADFVAQVVAELILLLVAQSGKKRDGRRELIVAVSLKAGDSDRRGR